MNIIQLAIEYGAPILYVEDDSIEYSSWYMN